MSDKTSASSVIIEFALLLALTALTFFIPLLGIVCALVSTVCVTVITCRHGAVRSYISLAAMLLFLLALSATRAPLDANTVFSCVITTFNLGLAGLAMGLALRGGCNLFRTVGAGCAGNLAAAVLELAKLRFLNGMDIIEELVNAPIREFFEIYRQALTAITTLTSETEEALNSIQWYIQQTLGAIMPAILIVFSLLNSYAAFLIARKLLYRVWHISYPDVTHFWGLQLSRATAMVLIATQLLATLASGTNFSGAMSNISVVLGMAYMLCGISVIDFFFRRTGVWGVLRGCIYVAGFFVLNLITAVMPLFNVTTVILMIGIADSIFDFRRLRQKGVPTS